MKFGLSPKYVINYNLENIEKEHFLVIAIEAAKKLGWDVSIVTKTGFIAYTKLSWSSWNDEITVQINESTAVIKSEFTGNQLIDWGKNKKNVEQLIFQIEKQKNILTFDEITTKIEEIKKQHDNSTSEITDLSSLRSKNKITNIFSIFIPTSGYFITPILLNLNIIIFILMLYSEVHILTPEYEDLINWGANYRPITIEGEWWRLFTSIFIHIGIIHLLFNMYALLYIGLIIEPYLGKSRFLAAYLISGIIASLTSFGWYDFTISAGASGAIFGMYGVFLALLTSNILDKSTQKAFFTSIAFFVGYNILNGLIPNSGIDNAAHIGGLLSGLIIGYSFIPSYKNYNNKKTKYATIFVLIISMLISSFIVYNTVPNSNKEYSNIMETYQKDIATYEKEMDKFVSMESMALEVYRMPTNASKGALLKELKERGIYYWHENLKLIKSFEKLKLPQIIIERNLMLKDYCELRIKSYELVYKKIEENSELYDNEINECNLKIENLINKLTSKDNN